MMENKKIGEKWKEGKDKRNPICEAKGDSVPFDTGF